MLDSVQDNKVAGWVLGNRAVVLAIQRQPGTNTMAVADADCTLSSDLGGIYFAVQANYEQQFVTANQQALGAGVRQYKAAFAKALKAMPALLQTTSATPNLPGPTQARHHGGHRGTVKTSPSHS